MAIVFRAIEEGNIDLIIPLVQKLDNNKDSDFILQQRFLEMFSQNYECLGVFDEDKLIGICGLWFCTRHYSGKSVELDHFYIDEDSWQVVIADQYNKQGEIWRVSLSYLKYYKEMPGILAVINVFHDLKSQEYHVMGLQNEEDRQTIFNGDIANNSMFTPAGFKRYMN